MCAMLVCGTANTIVMKAQDQVVVGVDDKGKNLTYNHPYVQCANMFVGEFTCLIAYGIKCWWKSRKSAQTEEGMPLSPGTNMANQVALKTKINPLYLAIPASCDVLGSSMMFVALTQCAASIYQMMRGIIVLITALMSIAFLGKKQYAHHWFSLFCIILGVAIVGIVGVSMSKKETHDDDSDVTPTTALGILLLIGSQCFTGCLFISEEKILSGYYLDPLLVVGLEGFWGICFYAILLPIMQHIDCSNPKMCATPTIEDTTTAFQQIGNSPMLIATSLGIIVSISCFNATGVAITKYASAAQRSTVDTSRTLLIWFISLFIGWEKFYWQELMGFFLLAGGTLVYNEIWVLPCDILNRNIKTELVKREGALETFRGEGQNPDMLTSSPGALYDSNRNKRNLENKLNERYDLVKDHEGEI